MLYNRKDLEVTCPPLWQACEHLPQHNNNNMENGRRCVADVSIVSRLRCHTTTCASCRTLLLYTCETSFTDTVGCLRDANDTQ